MKKLIALLILAFTVILISCGEKAPEPARADCVFRLTRLDEAPDALSGRVAFDGGTLTLSDNRLLLEKDGEVTERCADLTALFDKPVKRVNSLAVSDGRIYLCADSAIAVIDGEKVTSTGIPGSDARLIGSDDGVYLFRVGADYRVKVSRVSPELKSEDLELPEESVFERADVFMAHGKMYLSTADGLYSFDGGEAELICDYLNSDINYRAVRSLSVESDERFYFSAYENDELRYFVCDRLDESEVPLKYIINVAGSGASDELRTAILDFNRSSENYRAVLSDYSRFDTYEDPTRGSMKLRYDIVAGNIPDVMIFTEADERFGWKNSYMKAKMFADLYGYIDADPELSRGDFIDAVTKNNERGGKLYELATNVSIMSMTGKGGKYTLKSLLDETEKSGDAPFSGGGDYRLWQLLSLSLKEFVTDKGCDFDKPEFRKLLEMWKNPGESNEYEHEFIELSTAHDFVRYAAKYPPDEFTGLPTVSGSGTLIQISESFAISAKSTVKDGAWELIRTLALGKSGVFGFPTTRSELKEIINSEVGKRYAVSQSGSLNGLNDGQEVPSGKRLFVFTEDYADKFYSMIDGGTTGCAYLSPVMAIIREEASAYRSGAKGIDETIRLINDRVSTYISEVK